MDVIVFIRTIKDGWKKFGEYDNHRLALENINDGPQDTNYSIYWKKFDKTKLYPNVSATAYMVYEHKQSIAGKSCRHFKYNSITYCIKTDHMPYLFTDNLFEDD